MAMIDYGAILRVNGEFVNKNKGLFMDMKESMGFTLDKIDRNYYVYAGDNDLLLCFYKCCFRVISNGEIIKYYNGSEFNSESMIVNGVKIKVECLDKEYRVTKEDIDYNDKNYYTKRGWIRYVKRLRKIEKKRLYKRKSNRWLASWEYRGNKYEVIFGYGIEPNEDVWNKIKFDTDGYEFSKTEIDIIDKWFS